MLIGKRKKYNKIGKVWKEKRRWYVQFPKGVVSGYKTKKEALEIQKWLRT